MLIGRSLLIIIIMLSTLIFAAITTNLTNNLQSSTITTEKSNEQSESLVVPIQSLLSSAANQSACPEPCLIDYCLKYVSINKNCTKLIRDQCDCCTVCLRTENEICGGHFNIYGLCEKDLLCYKSNKTKPKNLTEQTGLCVKTCLKFQCLSVIINNKTTCECANRRLPCDENLHQNTSRQNCEQERELSLLKANDGKINSIIYHDTDLVV